MNKYLLLGIVFALTPLLSSAQSSKRNPQMDTESRYLQGAVPEVNGRIVFSKTIIPQKKMLDGGLFTVMSMWANENYGDINKSENNKVILSDFDKKEIACYGEDEMYFNKSKLLTDMTYIMYHLTVEINNGECIISIKNIKFTDGYDKQKTFPAKDMISDKAALQKNGKGLKRNKEKYRVYTINFVNNLFFAIETYLNSERSLGGKN